MLVLSEKSGFSSYFTYVLPEIFVNVLVFREHIEILPQIGFWEQYGVRMKIDPRIFYKISEIEQVLSMMESIIGLHSDESIRREILYEYIHKNFPGKESFQAEFLHAIRDRRYHHREINDYVFIFSHSLYIPLKIIEGVHIPYQVVRTRLECIETEHELIRLRQLGHIRIYIYKHHVTTPKKSMVHKISGPENERLIIRSYELSTDGEKIMVRIFPGGVELVLPVEVHEVFTTIFPCIGEKIQISLRLIGARILEYEIDGLCENLEVLNGRVEHMLS